MSNNYHAAIAANRNTLGNLTFWISLSLSPKSRPSSKLSQKVKSISSFGHSLNFKLSERLSKSLSPKFGLSPNLI